MTRIRSLRKKHGLSQTELASMLNVHQTAISQWEQGRTTPDVSLLARMSAVFGVSIDYLLGNDEPQRKTTKGMKIPVLGRVQAGIPIEAVEDIIDYEEITPELAATGEYFALSIQGDSMAPRICAGDVVIVRKQENVENGDVAVILVNGQDATVKRFFATEHGVKLVAFNPAYEPMFFSPDEVASLPVNVVGKVVELRGKL